jgi:probable rRNA maturation factor
MIEINNLTSFPLDEVFFKKIAQKILDVEDKGKADLSIAFVVRERIKELNKKYRNKEKATDVLSFLNKKDNFPSLNVLGEIVICPDVVKENADKFNFPFKEELSRVLIHGVLHILDYDHERSVKEAKTMKEKENYYLSLF